MIQSHQVDRTSNNCSRSVFCGSSGFVRRYRLSHCDAAWFVGQILAGPICLLGAHVSLDIAQPANPGSTQSRVAKTHARIAEIGTLYTAIAGMLNLLAIIDSSYRAGQTHGGAT